MSAPIEVYVDPAIAGNSGAGTIGDPYGDLQYALNTVTRNATHGNRFNIKAGTAEVLAAAITLATYGTTPTGAAPLLFRGYTSAAGDGGICEISTNGFLFWASTYPFVILQDMKITGNGVLTGTLVNISTNCLMTGCEVGNHAGTLVALDVKSRVFNSNFHDGSGIGILGGTDNAVIGCYFKNGSSLKFTVVIQSVMFVSRNIMSLSGATLGVYNDNAVALVMSNSILSSSGTGQGIYTRGSVQSGQVLGNLVEGFSGGGGVGIYNETQLNATGNNAVYNCATAYVAGDDHSSLGDNETLGATPFAKSGSDTFANRATYFAPVATGNVRGGAFPTILRLDKGAVQHADPASGGRVQSLTRGLVD